MDRFKFVDMPILKLNYSKETGKFIFDNRTQEDKYKKVREIFGTDP